MCQGSIRLMRGARKAINSYYDWEADVIVAEVNNGGDLVERMLRNIDHNVSYRSRKGNKR